LKDATESDSTVSDHIPLDSCVGILGRLATFLFFQNIDTHGNRSHTSKGLGNASKQEEYLTVRRLVLSSSDRGERPTL